MSIKESLARIIERVNNVITGEGGRVIFTTKKRERIELSKCEKKEDTPEWRQSVIDRLNQIG